MLVDKVKFSVKVKDTGVPSVYYINIANWEEFPILCYNFAGILRLTIGQGRKQ